MKPRQARHRLLYSHGRERPEVYEAVVKLRQSGVIVDRARKGMASIKQGRHYRTVNTTQLIAIAQNLTIIPLPDNDNINVTRPTLETNL